MYSFPFEAKQPIPADLTQLQLEMDLARQVQLSLLPKGALAYPGLDLSYFFQPASYVGGDFYDLVIGPDQLLTFFIGDVSGKGMPAAMLMTMTRFILRAEADSPAVPTPEVILQKANAKLLADFIRAGMFVTVFVGQYHPVSKELVFANAGHSAAIFHPVNGRPRLLKADGTALGIQEKSFSENHRLSLAAGDLFVATTDGVYESRNPNSKRFGMYRLLKQLQRLRGKSAAEIADALVQAVQQFSECEPQVDDQTILVVRCTGR
jgi:phosphoserine phosphatase RsbU/P